MKTSSISKQSDENFYILALDGGARGIYPACMLASVERNLGKPIKDCFDLITGTSTGAIIAGAVATGVEMSVVVDLFDKEDPQVFSKRRSIHGLVRSKYTRTRRRDRRSIRIVIDAPY